jgi:hypothetical protein
MPVVTATASTSVAAVKAALFLWTSDLTIPHNESCVLVAKTLCGDARVGRLTGRGLSNFPSDKGRPQFGSLSVPTLFSSSSSLWDPLSPC